VSTGFDAWNSPGWTIQHPVYSATVGGDVPALPAGVTPCTITCTYLSASGQGYYGAVTLAPSIPRVLIAQTEVLLPMVRGEVRAGQLNALIYAVPQDVIWTVREAVGASRQVYGVILPRNTAAADLTSLVRVPDGTPPIDGTGELFTGEGPPPQFIEGAAIGDTYLDILTGNLYTLE
jgi:hypothetical protein